MILDLPADQVRPGDRLAEAGQVREVTAVTRAGFPTSAGRPVLLRIDGVEGERRYAADEIVTIDRLEK